MLRIEDDALAMEGGRLLGIEESRQIGLFTLNRAYCARAAFD